MSQPSVFKLGDIVAYKQDPNPYVVISIDFLPSYYFITNDKSWLCRAHESDLTLYAPANSYPASIGTRSNPGAVSGAASCPPVDYVINPVQHTRACECGAWVTTYPDDHAKWCPAYKERRNEKHFSDY